MQLGKKLVCQRTQLGKICNNQPGNMGVKGILKGSKNACCRGAAPDKGQSRAAGSIWEREFFPRHSFVDMEVLDRQGFA